MGAAENRMHWTVSVFEAGNVKQPLCKSAREKLKALISSTLQTICTTFGVCREVIPPYNRKPRVSNAAVGPVPGARLLVPGRQSVVRTARDGPGGRGLLAVEGERHQRAQDRPRIGHQVHGL